LPGKSPYTWTELKEIGSEALELPENRLLGVFFEVGLGMFDDFGACLKETHHHIAAIAEEFTYLSCVVVMIQTETTFHVTLVDSTDGTVRLFVQLPLILELGNTIFPEYLSVLHDRLQKIEK
jgi:hypothetical protein